MTGRTSNQVPGQQNSYPDSRHCHDPANVITIRSRTEALIRVARTPIRYYLDKEEWSQELALEQEAIMEENMAAWESVLEDYDVLLNVDD
jgi:hypothetical protein